MRFAQLWQKILWGNHPSTNNLFPTYKCLKTYVGFDNLCDESSMCSTLCKNGVLKLHQHTSGFTMFGVFETPQGSDTLSAIYTTLSTHTAVKHSTNIWFHSLKTLGKPMRSRHGTCHLLNSEATVGNHLASNISFHLELFDKLCGAWSKRHIFTSVKQPWGDKLSNIRFH